MEKTLEQIIEAFDMMWGSFPDPVRLIDRNFNIVAANEAFTSTGGQINVKCNVGDPAMHKGCQAIAALNSGETKIMTSELGGRNWDSYWVPKIIMFISPAIRRLFLRCCKKWLRKIHSNSKSAEDAPLPISVCQKSLI